jgi:hypothetical protein
VNYTFGNILTDVSSRITKLSVGLDNEQAKLSNDWKPMYSNRQFAALERMYRERAALARKEMEYSLMEYWLAEAEEWKQLGQSPDPFKGRIANRSSDLAESNNAVHNVTRAWLRLPSYGIKPNFV